MFRSYSAPLVWFENTACKNSFNNYFRDEYYNQINQLATYVYIY